MTDAVRLALHDMLAAIDEARTILRDCDLAAYRRDVKTRRAFERVVEIVSEASRRLPDDLTESEPTIPWREVAAIGNRLRHEYQWVDDAIMWSIAARHFPDLELAVSRMIARIGSES